eukprot:6197504-Pleurochrysis_carterae.AAC.2
MPLVGGADLNATASSDATDLRFDRPYTILYRASPTGLVSMSQCNNNCHSVSICPTATPRAGCNQPALDVHCNQGGARKAGRATLVHSGRKSV